MVGVADADDDGLDLLQRLFLGRWRHPRDRLDALGEGGLDVFDHALNLGLGRRREIFVDIGLADRVLERVAGRVERQLVARALLRRPASAVPLNAKLASRNAFGRTLGRWLSVWNSSQSFHASSGCDPTRAASLGMAPA